MLDIIANKNAGGRLGKKFLRFRRYLDKVLKKNNIKYKFHYTERRGHATDITKELCESGKTTDLIVIGGDGTLHEVINGFTNFENVNLGIIPFGTGNDFALGLGLPINPEKALDIIIHDTPKYTDFMQLPTVRGLNIAGMGIDVDVLRKYAQLKKKNWTSYTMCLIKSLFQFDHIKFTAEYNGKTEEIKSFMACVANGYRYGGGIPICPIADPTDTKLNFLAVTPVYGIKRVSAFLKLKMGKILKLKQAHCEDIQSVKITCDEPYTVQIDGELYDNIPFEVNIVSNKLKVYRK